MAAAAIPAASIQRGPTLANLTGGDLGSTLLRETSADDTEAAKLD